METRKILIGCTGSVAAIKLGEIIETFLSDSQYKFEIKVITTKNAKHFITRSERPVEVPIYDDDNEWQMWSKRDDPVLHIELRKWADLMLIAPLDANTLAKMATGVCDNLLLCTTRAWNFEKPLFFSPAMNTRMWEHPITNQQIEILKNWGHIEIKCIAKKLMCGDIGYGAMETPAKIVQTVVEYLNCQVNKRTEE